MNLRRYVILDRDGTINREKHYLSDPGDLELLPGAARGLRSMAALGLGLMVVTNQSGLARGYFGQGRLAAIHARLRAMLEQEGVFLDAIYHCPHHPSDECACRKPQPGMVFAAARELGFDPGKSFVIGDKSCDVDLAANSRAASILVRTGYGAKEEARGVASDWVADDLEAAAGIIAGVLQSDKGRVVHATAG